MGLLEGGSPNYVPVTVYLQETVTDEDGNIQTRPSASGIATKASFQRDTQSGTSARLQEQNDEGFESQEIYTMRFPRSFTTYVAPQSEIEWNGSRWSVFGWPITYNSSPRTKHLIYTVKRN